MSIAALNDAAAPRARNSRRHGYVDLSRPNEAPRCSDAVVDEIGNNGRRTRTDVKRLADPGRRRPLGGLAKAALEDPRPPRRPAAAAGRRRCSRLDRRRPRRRRRPMGAEVAKGVVPLQVNHIYHANRAGARRPRWTPKADRLGARRRASYGAAVVDLHHRASRRGACAFVSPTPLGGSPSSARRLATLSTRTAPTKQRASCPTNRPVVARRRHDEHAVLADEGAFASFGAGTRRRRSPAPAEDASPPRGGKSSTPFRRAA